MSDDDARAAAAAELEALLDIGSRKSRVERIKSLSDQALTYFYSLLSDDRTITNVAALVDLEAEMHRRGLPGIRRH